MTNYNYLYQYTDINDGEVVDVGCQSNYQQTIDDLFLGTFLEYCDRTIDHWIQWEGHIDSYPSRISQLRGDTAELFKKMQFKLITGNLKPTKSLGFGKKS